MRAYAEHVFICDSLTLLADTTRYPKILIDSGCEYEAVLPLCAPSHPESVQICSLAHLLTARVLRAPIGRGLVTICVACRASVLQAFHFWNTSSLCPMQCLYCHKSAVCAICSLALHTQPPGKGIGTVLANFHSEGVWCYHSITVHIVRN